MKRHWWVKTWWLQAAVIAAALLVLTLVSILAFDRDNDGIDDGGLDLWINATIEIPSLLVTGLVLLDSSPLRPPGRHRFRSRPRSPPASHSSS